MPRPVSDRMRYLPGLDGLRAVAVLAVLGYHLDVPGMGGGLLGVGMFFTLSGYLITTILLRSWDDSGGVDLARFWRRRFRRLLPAVVLLLVAVLAATALVAPWDLAVRVRESLAALFYVSNWTTIAGGISYFERFAGPGALDHLWSLAVEEQFYLVWPLVLLGMLRVFRGRMSRVALTTLGVAALSFVVMAALAHPGFDNTRAYEGTDTRAGGLLIGAVVAMYWRPERLTDRIVPRARAIVDGLGIGALLVVLALMAFTDPFSLSLYRWGLLALSLATALLVAVVVHPASRLGAALGIAPLAWIGARSYGIYLWHLPVITFTPDTVLPEAPVLRGTIQIAVTVGLAALSWRLLEDPIRRHGIGVLVDRRPQVEPRSWSWSSAPSALRGTAILAAVASITLTSVGLLGGGLRQPPAAADQLSPPVPSPEPAAAPSPTPPPDPVDTSPDTSPDTPSPTPGETASASDPASEPSEPVVTPSPTTTAAPEVGEPGRTSCTSLVHVGDSTSVGLTDDNYLPDPADQIDARYADVGVEEFHAEIDGAMSTVERYQDHPNAPDRVEARLAAGEGGCWVYALGTNEAANQAVGGAVDFDERIARVMEPIDGEPALWLTTKTLLDDTPYSDAGAQAWNDALLAACDTYPNMRIYDWRSEVDTAWFISDGIHYTTPGYQQRSARIADALARAFPANGEPPEDCVVTSGR